jgi:hypothetical protein
VPTQYLYPTNAELYEIEQDLIPVLTEDDPIFQILPMETEDADLILWEQEDNFFGLQQERGINGAPGKVDAVGVNRWRLQPGYYGEFMEVDEQELTRRREFGSFNVPIKIDDLVRRRQEQLLERELKRVKWIGWTTICTGTFTVSLGNQAVGHTDTFNMQRYAATTTWATKATATPLADFRAVQLLARGHSVDFGAQATAYMNRATWNNFIANTNNADLFGRRTAGLATYENLDQVNKLLTGDDLPSIVVYDGNYLDNNGQVQTYIPANTVVVVGVRPNKRPVGNYVMTRNVNNENGQAGSYTIVIDSLNTGQPVPRKIWVHKGHNGGPKVVFPSSFVIMSV